MLVETGVGRTLLVVRLAPARQGDQYEVAAARRRANSPCELVPVHARHADVEQRDIRLERVQCFQGLQAIEGHRHLAILHFEQHPQAFGGVAVVIDDEHSLAGVRLRARGGDFDGGRCLNGARRRQGHDEFAAHARAVAAHFDVAHVQLDELLRERQADAEAAGLDPVVGMHAREQLEYARLRFGRDADAGVAHRHHDLFIAQFGPQRDGAARRRVLGGVVEQVLEHLRKPGGVAFDLQGDARNIDDQPVIARFDRRRRGLERVIDHAAQADAFIAQVHLAERDSRDVHEIVDQAHHVMHLPVDDLARRAHVFPGGIAGLEQVHRVADGRERIAQFVRQGRQEFVLAPVRVDQRALEILALGDVARGAGDGLDFAGCADDGNQ